MLKGTFLETRPSAFKPNKIQKTFVFELENPQLYKEEHNAYLRHLTAAGLRVPQTIFETFEENGKQKARITQDAVEGRPLAEILADKKISTQERVRHYEKVLEEVSKVLQYSRKTQREGLLVGLDVGPENFVITPNGGVHFIDTFPPLMQQNGKFPVSLTPPDKKDLLGRLTAHTPKSWKYKYAAHWPSIMSTLVVKSRVYDPKLGKMLRETTKRFIKSQNLSRLERHFLKQLTRRRIGWEYAKVKGYKALEKVTAAK